MSNITESFYGCESLESIKVPVSVSSVESDALGECTSLKDVFYAGSREQWNAIEIDMDGNDALKSATIHYGSASAEIIVYQVLGYDDNNLFLTKTDLDYYRLEEEGFVELGCHSILFEDRELCSFLERDEEGFYREKDINSFFIKDNILYVPFLDGTQGRINKFLWGWDNYFDKIDTPELYNNIIFDGEKHVF